MHKRFHVLGFFYPEVVRASVVEASCCRGFVFGCTRASSYAASTTHDAIVACLASIIYSWLVWYIAASKSKSARGARVSVQAYDPKGSVSSLSRTRGSGRFQE